MLRIQDESHGSRRHSLKAALIVALASSALIAQTTNQAASRPDYRQTHPVDKSMVDPRPAKPVLMPSQPGEMDDDAQDRSIGAVGSVDSETRLLPDGYIVSRRDAVVATNDDWKLLTLKPAEKRPNAPPIRVLPNRQLAVLEAILDAQGEGVTLQVTGRVTEFQGRNYILIDDLTEPKRQDFPTVEKSDRPEIHAPATSTAEAPTETETAGPDDKTAPTAEEVMDRLMGQRPPKEVVLPDQNRIAETKPAEAEDQDQHRQAVAKAARWAEDSLLIDRAGRVVPGDQWWSLAFENRSTHAAEAPIRLLPNRLLENALRISEAGTKAQVIRVSGEITEYKGTNFLLLRKVLVRRDMGNLQ